MDEKQTTALRTPFDPSLIGKLPRITCKDCRERSDKVCTKHSKTRCAECGNYITSAHLHLDYVGHAAVTDRLLKVDPEWTWEPMALGPNGEPLIVNGGLWIKLTIGGVTRPGWGDGDDIKVMIGDAIRNAAMRFGVALDLWAKEDLHAFETNSKAPPKTKDNGSPDDASLRAQLVELLKAEGHAEDAIADVLAKKAAEAPDGVLPISYVKKEIAAAQQRAKATA